MRRVSFALSVLIFSALVLSACATPTPEVVREEVEVPVEVEVTREVEVEVPVEVEVTREVEVEVPVAPEIQVVRVAMGYIPNFQYAPFYVGIEKGYFAEEGIQVVMDYGTEEDAVKKVASGNVQFGTSSGDSIILARENGIPVSYVMRWYNAWPTGLFALAESGIETPQDLVGKKVGIPGPFGANWVAWQALLANQGIDPDSITVEFIGFTQTSAVSEGQVDAAAGYMVNEPLQLESQGIAVNTIPTSDYVNLVPIGMFANDDFIAANPDLCQRFVRALLRSIDATVAEPDFALEAVISAVQFSGGDNRAGTQAGLEAVSILWTSPGAYDEDTWHVTQDIMFDLGMITQTPDVSEYYTNEFVEAAGY